MTLTTTLIPLSPSGASQTTMNLLLHLFRAIRATKTPILHLLRASRATKSQATKNQAIKNQATKPPILHLSRASQAAVTPVSQLQLTSSNRSHGRGITKTVRCSAQRMSIRTTFDTAFSCRGDNLQCYPVARTFWSKIWSKNPFL